jgi:hypothetical protein
VFLTIVNAAPWMDIGASPPPRMTVRDLCRDQSLFSRWSAPGFRPTENGATLTGRVAEATGGCALGQPLIPDVAPLSTFLMLAISFCGTFSGTPMLTPETLAHRIRFPLMEKVAWSRRFDSFSTKMSQMAVNMYRLAENCRNSCGGASHSDTA